MKKHILSLVIFIFAVQLNAQQIYQNYWETNGKVNTTVRVNNKIYIGGSFNYFGPTTGMATGFRITNPLQNIVNNSYSGSGSLVRTYNNDIIYAGDFVLPDGSQSRLMYFNNSGLLSTFNPVINGKIKTMSIDGNILYIGGEFTQVNGLTRKHAAAFDLNTKTLTSWSPSFNNNVNIISANAGSVLVGGDFTSVNGNIRNYFALVGSGGSINSLNIPFNGSVNALALVGTKLFCGGAFTKIDTALRSYLACFDVLSATLDTVWTPYTDDVVKGFYLSNSELFVYGDFHFVNDVLNRNYVMSFDLASGGLPTNFNPSPNQAVYDVAVSNGVIYLAGDFSYIGTTQISYLARVTPNGFVVPGVPIFGNTVRSVTVLNDSCLTTGDYSSFGGINVSNLIAIDATSGIPTGFAPQLDDEVNTIKFVSDGLLIGGAFSVINQLFYQGIAIIDTINGTPISWQADCNGIVNDIKISGNTIYVGGTFTSIGGQTRTNLASLNYATHDASSWDPQVSGSVYSLELANGHLYVGGLFSMVGNSQRNNAASFSVLNNLSLDNWSPNVNALVSAIKVKNESVFLAGTFTQVNATSIQGIAKVDSSATATLSSWNSGINGSVKCIDIFNNVICAGGDFNINNQTSFAMFNANDASLVSYQLKGNINGLHYTRVDYGKMYLGGQFNLSNAGGKSNFIVIDLSVNTPSAQASNLSFSSITTVSMRVHFKKGDGTKHLILASNTPITAIPTDGVSYSSGNGFGLGDFINNTDNVVYTGVDTTFVLNNLQTGTTYYLVVYEYNGFANFTKYNIVSAPSANATTLVSYNAPTISTTNVTFNRVTNNSMQIKWTSGNGTKRLIIAKEGSAPVATPSDGVTYYASNSYGNGQEIGNTEYVLMNDNLDSTIISGLKSGKTYYFTIYEYNGFDIFSKYKITAPGSANQATVAIANEPTTQSTSLVFSERTDSSFKVSWTNGNGASHLVVASKGILPGILVPQDGVGYQTDGYFNGTGSILGENDHVVYSGSGNSFTIKGLVPATTYYIRVFEFNGNNYSSNYLIDNPLTGSYASDFLIKRPSIASSNIRITYITHDTAIIKWNKGNGDYRLLAVHKNSAVTAKPTDGKFYRSNIRYGKGDTLADHSFVVFESDGDSAIITQLEGNKTYYFSIFEFSIDPSIGPIFQSINSADSSFTTLENSVNELNANSIKIYPNPVQNDFNIISINSDINITEIQLLSIDGKIIQRHTSINILPMQKIDVSYLTPGFYVVCLKTNKGVFNMKIEKK